MNWVSVHGGHSGKYCSHARDDLEDIVLRYIERGFSWVCLTEHMPSSTLELIAPEERAEGLTVYDVQSRMERYFAEAFLLKKRYADQIDILVGFETDAYSGYLEDVAALIERYKPDMIVGSVHHLHDILFDASADDYAKAASISGGIDELYCDYFDKQLELIEHFRPPVVGHFDLVRLMDPDYPTRFEVPKVRDHALRNLIRIKELGLTLDINMRALSKGADEPYLTESLMQFAIEEDIHMAPGDDSHGITDVGKNYEQGLAIFTARGGKTDWQKPTWHAA